MWAGFTTMAAFRSTLRGALVITCALSLSIVAAQNCGKYPLTTSCGLANPNILSQCFEGAINKDIKQFVPNGLPIIGLPSLDPIKPPTIKVPSGSSNLVLSNCQVTGGSKSFIKNLQVVPFQTNQYDHVVPNFSMKCSYQMDKGWAGVNIANKGTFTLLAADYTAHFRLQVTTEKRCGKDYLIQPASSSHFVNSRTFQPHFSGLATQPNKDLKQLLTSAFDKVQDKIIVDWMRILFLNVPEISVNIPTAKAGEVKVCITPPPKC